MELQLDRNLSNKRIFPAVNIVASSTRRDDLLLDKTTLDRMWILRKYLADMNPIEAMDFVKSRLENTKDNEEIPDEHELIKNKSLLLNDAGCTFSLRYGLFFIILQSIYQCINLLICP